jgi:hypothetical protein
MSPFAEVPTSDSYSTTGDVYSESSAVHANQSRTYMSSPNLELLHPIIRMWVRPVPLERAHS